MRSKQLLALAEHALADLKARDVKVLDVRQLTTIADYMVVASGTSDRHVKSIADRLVQRASEAGCKPLGVEGTGSGEWVLVDLADVIVHIMQPKAREFYKLESLWDMGAAATA
ncbi:MAG: ribosome silencing factor [Gammaproteobacteria bacterium]